MCRVPCQTRWARGLTNERRPRRCAQSNLGDIHTCGITGFLPVSTRAFVKSARITKPNQVKIKTQNMKQLNKAKTDIKSSLRCRGSGTALEVPASVRCAMARNAILWNRVGECASASSLDTSSTGTSIVQQRLALPTSALEGGRAPPPPPMSLPSNSDKSSPRTPSMGVVVEGSAVDLAPIP